MHLSDDLAPGCFGSALAYSAEETICSACSFAVTCEEKVKQRRQYIFERLLETDKQQAKRFARAHGVTVTEKTVTNEQKPTTSAQEVKKAITAPKTEKRATLTKKAREQLQRLERASIDLAELRHGRNPFATTPSANWLMLLCDALRKRDCSRSELNDLLQSGTDMSQKSIQSHLSIARSLLTATNVIDPTVGDSFVVRRV